MKKIFFTIWIICFLCALFIVLSGKIKPLGRIFLVDDLHYGDLFRISKLDDFALHIKRDEGNEDDTPASAKIICCGDSFFNVGRDSKIFADLLEDRIQSNVCNVPKEDFIDTDYNPLIFLKKHNYKKAEEKLLILEAVERYSLGYSYHYWKTGYMKMKKVARSIRDIIFDNSDIEFFFQENHVVYPVNKAIKNLKYRYLDEVDSKIFPISKDPGILFFHEGTMFNLSRKTTEDIQNLCNSIQFLSDKLKSDFNVTLLYIILPNKYSLYGNLVHKEYVYDNFIPKVNKILKEKQINIIDVFSLYLQYIKQDKDNLLYYPNDTHATPLGVKILLDAVVEKLIEMGYYYP